MNIEVKEHYKIITPSEGMYLYNGEVVCTSATLPLKAVEGVWQEVDEDFKERWDKEQQAEQERLNREQQEAQEQEQGQSEQA